MGRLWRPRRPWGASTCSRPPTWTRPWRSPSCARLPAAGLSCGRSWTPLGARRARNRGPGVDRGPGRGRSPGHRRQQAFVLAATVPRLTSCEDRAMAYDEGLATRVREVLGDRPGLAEKQMFGGLAFLLHGNMACGVRADDLIVRVAADDAETAMGEPGTRPFDLTGRPMKGWLLVDADGHAEDADLRRWIDRGLAERIAERGRHDVRVGAASVGDAARPRVREAGQGQLRENNGLGSGVVP